MLPTGLSLPTRLGLAARGGGGVSAAYQQILDAVEAVDANASVYNPDDPNTRTVRESGGTTFTSEVTDGLGNREALVQATESRQPPLRELSTGRLVWQGDGASNYFMLADFASAISQPLTLLVVGRRSANGELFVDGNSATGGRCIMGADDSGNGDIWAGSWISASADTGFDLATWQGNYNGASSEVFKNGISLQTGGTGANGLGGIGIMQRGDLGLILDGDLGLVVAFPTERTNAELANLRSVINDAYPIGATS